MSVHTWLCWAVIGLALVTLVATSWLNAPYGRHRRRGWGPTMSTRLMWVVMESPACIGFAIVYLLGRHRWDLVPLILFGLWQLHYVDRTFLHPLRIRTEGKRTPIVVAALGFTFQALNSFINARYISELGSYAVTWLHDPRFLLGLLVFLGGRHLNRAADRTLIALRERGGGYHVPRGGAFEWISCPNYLGEIIEWTGWAVMTWSLSGLAFAIYTFANLAPRAVSHHRWYRERFPDYPGHRRALIPFLL
jgi:protein-S-isoprenylcysteine O-methyltransferase Ste14